MKLVIFTHPVFSSSQSMPRFAAMIKNSMVRRGYEVELWSPRPVLRSVFRSGFLAKWAGYFDSYVLFPRWVDARLSTIGDDSLFVFCDQALGPWVPLVSNRPHVVHCHDFSALRSALGLVPENPTSLSGLLYQKFIRRGFRKARHFISISSLTQKDLVVYGLAKPVSSAVVFNGLNYDYSPMMLDDAARTLAIGGIALEQAGMILHIGGGQWYKNTEGVIRIYDQYVRASEAPVPLWLVGPPPSSSVQKLIDRLPHGARVRFFSGVENKVLQAMYSSAGLLLFPSFFEGFGWPIIEAQACGCPVVTTNAPPMNEIGGPVVHYLPLLTLGHDVNVWATDAAGVVRQVLDLPEGEKLNRRRLGLEWASRFGAEETIDRYLSIYKEIFQSEFDKAGAKS